MRAQYAREIEAAHSQLGERETELGAEHIKVLQEQRDRHHKGWLTQLTAQPCSCYMCLQWVQQSLPSIYRMR